MLNLVSRPGDAANVHTARARSQTHIRRNRIDRALPGCLRDGLLEETDLPLPSKSEAEMDCRCRPVVMKGFGEMRRARKEGRTRGSGWRGRTHRAMRDVRLRNG